MDDCIKNQQNNFNKSAFKLDIKLKTLSPSDQPKNQNKTERPTGGKMRMRLTSKQNNSNNILKTD
jgi:hypothetical protein